MIAFESCGIVALTTDFGMSDPYVGMMKGVILGRAPLARVVDVTHGVPAQDVRAGGFFLSRAWPYFPAGTVHVAVVDPGVGTKRRMLLALDHGQCFLAPDNGLLAPVISSAGEVHELDVARFVLANPARTFHGRDILAPAAAALCAGLAPAGAVRERVLDFEPRTRARHVADPSEIEIVCADHFGNLVLDISPDELPGGLASWSIEAKDRRIEFRATYADGRRGELLALVDSYGLIEIAVRDGSARDMLALAPGDHVTFRRRS